MKLINLRKLIREYIDEMAYGGLVGATMDMPKPEDDRFRDDSVERTVTPKSLERFHRTPLYMKKANAAFKHFPFDIWIQPVSDTYGNSEIFNANTTGSGNRLDIIDVNKLKQYNEWYNLPVDIDKISSIVHSGGCVIFSMTSNLRPNFLPTPWMIIHAMFDSNSRHGNDINCLSDDISDYIDLRFDDPLDDIAPYMTTKSANNMTSESEIMHELCVQEVITTNGVQFKDANDSELNEKLEMLKEKIKSYNLKEAFANAIRGKIVIVSVGE